MQKIKNSYWKMRMGAFKKSQRAWWCFKIFSALFLFSMCAEFIANDRPILMYIKNYGLFTPVFHDYSEQDFGFELPTLADYKDVAVKSYINENGFAIWPIVEFDYRAINFDVENPSGLSLQNFLGTDDHGRDVFARLLYGVRLSIIFAILTVALSSIFGIISGVGMGYFGGRFDLIFGRFIEVYNGLPQMFILIIATGIFAPSFIILMIIMTVFSWTSLSGVVRAEVLKIRNMDYVIASKLFGLSNIKIIFRHVLPNSLTAIITYLPFAMIGAIGYLTALDFLGFGMPAGSASLGDVLRQGKENLEHPILAISGFFTVSFLLILLIFIGEGVRESFDIQGIKNSENGIKNDK
ncbi:MAG: ABC transporter permease [Rickettsiales bacterium]|jgi:microcin C transport system permease protein|nr:ABC transporter permease [Rickettsiales bacterium]